MNEIKTIAFDADDTLWVNEPIFTNTRLRFEELLANYISQESLENELYNVERRNLSLFGYGIKGFMLSMIETAIELTDGKVSGAHLQQVIDMGKEMLAHPVHLLPGVEETVLQLKEDYNVVMITKGDLFDQENKIARSGIAQHFGWIEIVSEKDEASYQEVFHKYQVDADSFLMVGNSLKSDILPICNLGARAIHIPFHDTWQHELIADLDYDAVFKTAKKITEVPRILAQY